MHWRSTVLHPSPDTWCWLIDSNTNNMVIGYATSDDAWRVPWPDLPDFSFKPTHYWIIELPCNLPGDPE